MAGFDGNGCYYYIWDINSNSLSAEAPFPLGKSSIDLTHLNLDAGVAQESDDVTNLHAANVYYRLKIEDGNGLYSYSHIVTIHLKKQTTI